MGVLSIGDTVLIRRTFLSQLETIFIAKIEMNIISPYDSKITFISSSGVEEINLFSLSIWINQ